MKELVPEVDNLGSLKIDLLIEKILSITEIQIHVVLLRTMTHFCHVILDFKGLTKKIKNE